MAKPKGPSSSGGHPGSSGGGQHGGGTGNNNSGHGGGGTPPKGAASVPPASSITAAQHTTAQAIQHGHPPGAPGGPGGGPANTGYRPANRTDQELQNDLDPNPRPGETPDQAADRVDAAGAEIEVRRYLDTYEQLGADPPRFDIASNDADHANVTGRGHPHTNERHGPGVRLDRDPNQTDRTIEGRIYGDPPWNGHANYSYRWDDPSVQNRAINQYVSQHWDDIRHDLAATGEHSGNFNYGNRVGEGFYNDGAYGAGPRNAHHHATSHAEVRISIVPGSDPPKPYIVSAFPSANPRG
ncbi:hypothetical protein [Micromonospora auratinigra]|uniref:Uncharacterized protein n=1 Tax=Micromonospora auratinigra TaxID=261654 RepID=A0A1A8ZZM3_9ACTN|nr:hypothetical protein [Micromonospora auratinigra]SBT49341.1 hypothetical protein GA0070611_4378 [Micromonospora auratinigra]